MSDWRLNRAIAVADFILEGDGHSKRDAAKEFGCCITTIDRHIKYLGFEAFYDDNPQCSLSSKDLKLKYLRVKKVMKNMQSVNGTKNMANLNNARGKKN